MQTDLTRTICQRVQLLSQEQQQKILEITENFLSGEETQTAWQKLKTAEAKHREGFDFNNTENLLDDIEGAFRK